MSILSAQSIAYRVETGADLKIEPFVPVSKQTSGMSYGLTAAGYDIRIGDMGDSPLKMGALRRQALTLPPGEFVLVASLERVKIPNDLQVIVHDKSSWARQGLALQNTVLEPGWEGFITLELSNHGKAPLSLFRGHPIAQLVFHQLDQPTNIPYKGKYQNQGAEPMEYIHAKE